MAASIYAQVTDIILRQLETADPASWTCPWHRSAGTGLPTNALTQRTYRGINVLSLWCAARLHGFAEDRWGTYRQWAELGGQVRRGEKGSLVVFYKDLTDPGAAGGQNNRPSARRRQIGESAAGGGGGDRGGGIGTSTDSDGPRFIARASTVFNIDQIEGLPASSAADFQPLMPTPSFDSFVAATGARIRFEGERAAYRPATDDILMPPRSRFISANGYTGTLAHELVHWTGAPHRLHRDLGSRFGSRAYAAEELVAELGAAFVLAGLRLAATPRADHAAYMAAWLPLLRADPRALFTAAAHAARAADYLQEATSSPPDAYA